MTEPKENIDFDFGETETQRHQNLLNRISDFITLFDSAEKKIKITKKIL